MALAIAGCGPSSAPSDEVQSEALISESNDSEPETESQLPAGDPIRIGALFPLSAPGSVVGGEAMRDAMIIAAERINAAGGLLGRPVELIVVDSEGLPERGAAVTERLISQDGVVAIAGGYHSSVGVVAKEVAHDNNIPIVLANTWNDTITSVQYPQVFRIAPLSSEVSAVDVKFIQWLRDEAGIQLDKVVILTENTDYGIPAAADTSRLLEAAGIEPVTFGVDIGTQDFAGIIERIKAEEPDFIMSLATGEASYNFAQQCADAGIGPQDLPTLCEHVALESESFWRNVPDGNYCFVRRIGLPPQLYNDIALEFLAEYEARTGKEGAESYAFAAYDAVRIIAQAITEAGTTDPNDIIAALEEISYEGALGTITFPINSRNTPQDAGVDPKWWHQFPDPAVTVVQYQRQGEDSVGATVVFPHTYQTGDPIVVGQ
ncbi:MAG: ABC transporter substrate-binding protein [Caldilineaceae bacterium SB0668_bin_21]|nr:ABC transporter substrate-binding protein [Caldilineaceae bacterium SB0668_bin_21]MYC20061.1 ABC transporter substrate-binding protein [Caldilineaceae bacterium SB0662_bin_25]